MAVRHTIGPDQPDGAAAPTVTRISFDAAPRNAGGAQPLLLRAYTRTKYEPGGTLYTVNVSAVLLVSKLARSDPVEKLPA
jgi:hypothetical protein